MKKVHFFLLGVLVFEFSTINAQPNVVSPLQFTWVQPATNNLIVDKPDYEVKFTYREVEGLSVAYEIEPSAAYTAVPRMPIVVPDVKNCPTGKKCEGGKVSLKPGANTITVAFKKGDKTRTEQRVIYYETNASTSQYVALLIGVSDYDDAARLSDLTDPKPSDQADSISWVLKERYDFRKVVLLKDATKQQYLDILTTNKNEWKDAKLFVFFGGHGSCEGWAFKDGILPHKENRSALAGLELRQLLVVVDACVAGSFGHTTPCESIKNSSGTQGSNPAPKSTRAPSLDNAPLDNVPEPANSDDVKKMSDKKIYYAIFSGAIEKVWNKTRFVAVLQGALRSNTSAEFHHENLYDPVSKVITNTATKPQAGVIGIDFPISESGLFVFPLKKEFVKK